jgi:hypothetical protein
VRELRRIQVTGMSLFCLPHLSREASAQPSRKPEAIIELETALKLQPDFPQAKQELKKLK